MWLFNIGDPDFYLKRKKYGYIGPYKISKNFPSLPGGHAWKWLVVCSFKRNNLKKRITDNAEKIRAGVKGFYP